jgi:hypothetical protein
MGPFAILSGAALLAGIGVLGAAIYGFSLGEIQAEPEEDDEPIPGRVVVVARANDSETYRSLCEGENDG